MNLNLDQTRRDRNFIVHYKLPNLDSIVEDEPRVLIPPLLEKKEVKLEICKVFKRCHGYC
jgi:hypothetical protein